VILDVYMGGGQRRKLADVVASLVYRSLVGGRGVAVAGGCNQPVKQLCVPYLCCT
jgi:hypothetical protein